MDAVRQAGDGGLWRSKLRWTAPVSYAELTHMMAKLTIDFIAVAASCSIDHPSRRLGFLGLLSSEATPDTSLEAPDEAIFRRQLRERLLLVLDSLPPREGHVLKLRHGLEDGKCRYLEQIGSISHFSEEWIRTIEKSAMSKLRNEDVHHELKDFCGF